MRTKHDREPMMFTADRLKRGNFSFVGDVDISGDLRVSGTVVVGGNLMVRGNCSVGTLLALGNVTVLGAVKGGAIYLRGTFRCLGEVTSDSLCIFANLYIVRSRAPIPVSDDQYAFASLRYPRDEVGHDDAFMHGYAVEVSRAALQVKHLEIDGGLLVGGNCTLSHGDIFGRLTVHGHLRARTLSGLNAQSRVDGNIEIEGSVELQGDLHCRGICVVGNISVSHSLRIDKALIAKQGIAAGHHIVSGNRIVSRGAIYAGKSIQSASSIYANGSIVAGRGYGIHAGLQVSRSEMLSNGYIATEIKPAAVKSGAFTGSKRYKKLTPAQMEKWPAADGSDGVEESRGDSRLLVQTSG